MADKDEFGVSMKAELEKWKHRMDEAERKAEAKGPDFSERFQTARNNARTKYDETLYQLSLLKNQSGGAWEEVKKGVDSAFEEMKKAVRQALDHF